MGKAPTTLTCIYSVTENAIPWYLLGPHGLGNGNG